MSTERIHLQGSDVGLNTLIENLIPVAEDRVTDMLESAKVEADDGSFATEVPQLITLIMVAFKQLIVSDLAEHKLKGMEPKDDAQFKSIIRLHMTELMPRLMDYAYTVQDVPEDIKQDVNNMLAKMAKGALDES